MKDNIGAWWCIVLGLPGLVLGALLGPSIYTFKVMVESTDRFIESAPDRMEKRSQARAERKARAAADRKEARP